MCGVTWFGDNRVQLQCQTTYCGVDNIPVAGRGEVVEEEEEGQDEESDEYWEDHQDTGVTHTTHCSGGPGFSSPLAPGSSSSDGFR